MSTIDKTEFVLPRTPSIPESRDDNALMPAEFAGMYQSGFEAGYKRGHETGYDKGFSAGMAAVRQGPNNGASSAVEGKPAPKAGPRRMLLGMPCKSCHIYLLSDETQCPSCKQMRTA